MNRSDPPTTVIHVRSMGDYELRRAIDAGEVVYIGRSMRKLSLWDVGWGNPFPVKRESERQAVIDRYRFWLMEPGQAALRARLPELKGKKLACWCKRAGRDVPCHGDVLAQLAEAAP